MLSDDFLVNQVPQDRLCVWQERLGNGYQEGQVVVVGEEAQHLAGFVCIFPNHDEYGALLDNLHVAPKYQRQGIGKHLMSLAISDLRGSSSGMCLWVLSQNTDAINFYKKLGGRLADERPYPGLGDKPVLAVRMVWEAEDLSKITE